MIKYKRPDVERMMADTEFMQLVKMNNKLNECINNMVDNYSTDIVKVELALVGSSNHGDANYLDENAEMENLNNKLDDQMNIYCNINQIPRDTLKEMLNYFKD